MEGSQGIEDRRHMQTPMVAEARNSRYQTCSKVPSKRQALAHIQSPTTDAAAPNKTKAQGILHAANDVADDRPDHDSMVAGLLSRLESKPEITRFALRSALDGVRLGGHLRHPHKLTTDAIARCQARTAVQGG
ncbi:hypothetical protein AAEP93_007168 [Penicillium crustosum]